MATAISVDLESWFAVKNRIHGLTGKRQLLLVEFMSSLGTGHCGSPSYQHQVATGTVWFWFSWHLWHFLTQLRTHGSSTVYPHKLRPLLSPVLTGGATGPNSQVSDWKLVLFFVKALKKTHQPSGDQSSFCRSKLEPMYIERPGSSRRKRQMLRLRPASAWSSFAQPVSQFMIALKIDMHAVSSKQAGIASWIYLERIGFIDHLYRYLFWALLSPCCFGHSRLTASQHLAVCSSGKSYSGSPRQKRPAFWGRHDAEVMTLAPTQRGCVVWSTSQIGCNVRVKSRSEIEEYIQIYWVEFI